MLTESDGCKGFGHCLRGPEGDVLVIVTPHAWYGFFASVLHAVDAARRDSWDGAETILEALLGSPVPAPGAEVALGDRLLFVRPSDTDVDLPEPGFLGILDVLTPRMLLVVVGALLTEKRVIVSSSSLRLVSSAVLCLNALLTPFAWQHVFIPLLPKALIGYVCAPFPFLMGMPSSLLPEFRNQPAEEVILVDLDAKDILKYGSDGSDIVGVPKSLGKKLAEGLQKELTIHKKTGTFNDSVIYDLFLHFFLSLLSHYRSFYTADEARDFDHDAFVAAAPYQNHHLQQPVEDEIEQSC